eukprot:SAG11_NODE_22140_length_411_cov_0.987179_1_plen_36_part_10
MVLASTVPKFPMPKISWIIPQSPIAPVLALGTAPDF